MAKILRKAQKRLEARVKDAHNTRANMKGNGNPEAYRIPGSMKK